MASYNDDSTHQYDRDLMAQKSRVKKRLTRGKQIPNESIQRLTTKQMKIPN